MRLALVINRSAGLFRRLPLDPMVAALARRLRADGHRLDIEVCGRRDLAAALTAAAQAVGLDGVLVGGGDGSVLTAIQAGLGTAARPLGVLPLGTLNLFARDLGLPIAPVAAAGALAQCHAAAIDLAEVNGLPFAIWASLGLHPWMVRRRDHLQRDGMGKWRAMVLAALRALRRYPMLRVRLAIGEETLVLDTPSVIVTNNRWRPGPPPPARPRLDQGLLQVHVVRAASRRGLVWLALNALIGRWPAGGLLETHDCERLQVIGRHRRTMLSLDGEVAVIRSPLMFRSRPGALHVLLPGPAP
jgi:diacylglycerol kinase family enzyme